MDADLSRTRWRKSSRSGGEGAECVELAWAGAVRDAKNPTRPVLTSDPDAVREFLAFTTAPGGHTTTPPDSLNYDWD